MPAKRSSSAPGDADKLIAHQVRILKAPRIAEHYHRLAEQGRDAGWTWRTTSVPYSPWNQCPRRIRRRQHPPPFPAIKTISDFDFTAQPSIDRPDRPEAGGWLAENPQYRTAQPARDQQNTSGHRTGYRRSPCRAPRRIRPGHRMDRHPTRRSTPHQPTRCRTTQDLPLRTHRDRRVGYIPFDTEAANLFFQLVSTRYREISIILTSNLPLSRWGQSSAKPPSLSDDRQNRAPRRRHRTQRRQLSHQNTAIDTLPSVEADRRADSTP